ncbi:hypothetical protein [Natrinema sp. DC36]|uniref:hypothetical protein n=1 Tax=Natrinema sp. DC36 TaxID=2878680 RepID=UPI001CF0086A|nr:hypothetical protein [Natrinema sp. DC36]
MSGSFLRGPRLWALIALVGVGGNLLLVYLASESFFATANAVVVALVAFAIGMNRDAWAAD